MYTLTRGQLGPLATGPFKSYQELLQTLLDAIRNGSYDSTLVHPDLGGCSDLRPVLYGEANSRPVVLGSGPLTTLIGYEFTQQPLRGSSLEERLIEIEGKLSPVMNGQRGCVHTDESHLGEDRKCGCRALNEIVAICNKMAECAATLFAEDPELGRQVTVLTELGIHQRFVPKSTTGALYEHLVSNGFARTILVGTTKAPFGGVIFDEREDRFLNRPALYRESGLTFYLAHLGALRRMARALFPDNEKLAKQFYLVARAFNLAGLYLFCHPDTPTYTIQ
ncbi:MAG TPA: hypothetical protein VNG90_00690 [Candidatus Acidoferrum sp.]|nr:hypothetical protein [Candidatus Acidoferrum sp.]